MSRKISLNIDVLTAAKGRISWVFDTFEKIYLSFSGGKDSTVMLHLVMDEAKRRNRKIGVLFIDLEAQYKLTIEHIENCYILYKDYIIPHWVALPLILRNAVSQYTPRWVCWDPGLKHMWVRGQHPLSITDPNIYSWFKPGMEFEEFTVKFGINYAEDTKTACLVGIRADESLNRFRTLIADKTKYANKSWTTGITPHLWNIYPLYDWKTSDLWVYHAKTGTPYNKLYDRMHLAGLTPHQMRICQPYGDDQRKGLWLYQIIEPENWGKIVARVNGANSGALYALESGNITGNFKITKPPGHTWESYAELLLNTLPPHTAEHYRNKIILFIKWYKERGYPEGIPDEGPMNEKGNPSWTRICKALLRNDYWCKGLSFTQTKSHSYERYLKLMRERRLKWGI